MEDSEASAYASASSTLSGFMDKRRRSSLVRRPRDIKDNFKFLPPSTQASPGSVSENPLKLKLKLGGGVTRTLHTNSDGRHVQKTLSLGELHPSETFNGGVESMPEKNKRGRRVLEPELDSDVDVDDDDDGDEEIRYLEKLKSKRVIRDHHNNYHEKEEKAHSSSDKLGVTERKKMRMGVIDSVPEGATGSQIPTTRNRALQSGRDPGSVVGTVPLEFPDGLPCASSKRQKQKLSEVEQQSKKAEAAQRRRMQSEKAAQEAEAEAIRKILGQDSGRKKKEEKKKKQQEERAQEKAARSTTLSSNTIRLVIGPGGTTVTFSQDIGLPDLFKASACSYPPPREKCVGPNCEKEYKYRDSKSKLPLCSLGCYKAVQEKMERSCDSLLIML